jgi:hypothetical protein
MVADGNKRLDAVAAITANASTIVTNAARSLFAEQPPKAVKFPRMVVSLRKQPSRARATSCHKQNYDKKDQKQSTY